MDYLMTVKGKLIMGKNSRIYDSYVEGNVYIGDNTKVGPHAYIRGTTSISPARVAAT